MNTLSNNVFVELNEEEIFTLNGGFVSEFLPNVIDSTVNAAQAIFDMGYRFGSAVGNFVNSIFRS